MDLVKWIRNQWDRVLAWLLAGAGGLALVLGWLGVTDTPYSWEQIPYVISGGLGGLYLLGLGAMFWFSADLRDEWRKLDSLTEVELRLVELLESSQVERGIDEPPAAPETNGRSSRRPARSGATAGRNGAGSAA
jgi:hypothetical protein